jgi:hypothetical protein
MGGRLEAQEESHAVLYRAVLREIGFDALLLAPADLTVAAMCRPFAGGPTVEVPRPPLNLRLADGSPAALTQPFADFEVGGIPVRVLSIVDPEEAERLVADGLAVGFVSAAAALQSIQPRPDALWIVSARLSGVELEALRAALPRLGPAVVVDAARGTGATRLEDAPVAARTGEPSLVVSIDPRGRGVGILDLDPRPEGGWTVSWHAMELADELATAPSPLRDGPVRDLVARHRSEVIDRGYLESFPTIPFAGGLRYLGSGACAKCHPGIFEEWVNGPHATALASLARVEHGSDPACARCHVVGFERFPDGRWQRIAGGFSHPRRTQHLGGVGCEACHGPGSAHAADPLDGSLWAPGRPNRARPGRESCLRCHDADIDEGFASAFEREHLPRVDHRAVPADRRFASPSR